MNKTKTIILLIILVAIGGLVLYGQDDSSRPKLELSDFKSQK